MKKQVILGGAAGVCLAVLVGCSVYTISMNGKMYKQLNNLQSEMEQMKKDVAAKDEEEPVAESELTIGEHYHILDTTAISDAYKSGNEEELQEQDKETLQMAKEVLKTVVKDEMTPFEKEDAIYQWMCQNIKYDDGSMNAIPTAGEYCDRPYGVLKNKKAVCVGYATTFRLFMEMLDVPCKVVHDKELSHSWDLVKLEDEWYHVDLTFDNNGEGISGNYRNFNMTDDMAQRNGHDWEKADYPAANGFTYLVANQKKEKIKNEMAIITKVKKLLDNQENYGFLEFEKDVNSDFVNSILSAIQERMPENTFLDYSFVAISEDKSVLAVYFTYYNENTLGGASGVTEEEYEKMMKKVEDVFGTVVNGMGDFSSDEIEDYVSFQ